MRKDKILKITMGLPGCGKSTWVKSEKKEHGYGFFRDFDFDRVTTGKIEIENFAKELNEYILYGSIILVDGLFLTYSDIEKLLSLIDKKGLKTLQKIFIEWWTPDIEACLRNDRGRRDKNSEITIRNAKLEEVDTEFIKKLENKFPELSGKISRKIHSIYMKEDYLIFAKINGLYPDNDGIVKGRSWSLGGTWRNCWGTGGEVSAEPQPDTFPEFDDLLLKICPNISYLQYKSLYSKVVNTETFSDGDYYGGSTSNAYKYFNIEYLYNELKRMELI